MPKSGKSSTRSEDTIGLFKRRVSRSSVNLRGEEEADKIVTVDEYPKGFPRLSAFVSSDDDFLMVRSFSRCHNRLLLHLQVEITELEKALDDLDKKDEADPAMKYRRISTKHKENEDTGLATLMSELKDKLREYGEYTAEHLAQSCAQRSTNEGR